MDDEADPDTPDEVILLTTGDCELTKELLDAKGVLMAAKEPLWKILDREDFTVLFTRKIGLLALVNWLLEEDCEALEESWCNKLVDNNTLLLGDGRKLLEETPWNDGLGTSDDET